MCGRYTSYSVLGDVQLAFDIDSLGSECESLRPSWNVAPTQDIPIVVERIALEAVEHAPNGVVRELHVARWGLVPPWSKDPAKGPQLINARIETLAEKRTFAQSLAKRRCIVPADGYYEWQAAAGGKIPHYIHSASGALLAFAGLYGWWKNPDGTWLLTATIITASAQGNLAAIHDRNPVVLTSAEYASWLDPSQQDPHAALALIGRPNQTLRADVVAKAVGNIRNNSPENIVPVPE